MCGFVGAWSLGYDPTAGQDLDGDGLSDLLLDNYNDFGDAGVFAVLGDPAFVSTTVAASDRWFVADPAEPNVEMCVPGDVDGDGYLDLGVVAEETLYLLLGPPTTGLTTADAYASSTALAIDCHDGADTNGDGVDELLFESMSTLYRFGLPLSSGAFSGAEGQITFPDELAGVTAADVTGDGADDVMVGVGAMFYLFAGGEW